MNSSFISGTKVKILSGTFLGMIGVVISIEDADREQQKSGGEAFNPLIHKNAVPVLLTFWEREIPIYFDYSELEVTN